MVPRGKLSCRTEPWQKRRFMIQLIMIKQTKTATVDAPWIYWRGILIDLTENAKMESEGRLKMQGRKT